MSVVLGAGLNADSTLIRRHVILPQRMFFEYFRRNVMLDSSIKDIIYSLGLVTPILPCLL
jgi:hypothetical protein